MVQEISPPELQALWQAGSRPYVLDVREAWELATAKIEPVVHIPMSAIPERLSELPTQERVIVMCRSGGRSLQVARFLESKGFADVANLTGGILAWSEQVDAKVPRY